MYVRDQFKGLECLLKKYFKNDDLEVGSFQVKNLLPPGENYCSEIMKLDVTYKNNKNDSEEEEELHLVAKANVLCDKAMINWPEVLRKELFVYAELLPAYREIEREAGFSDDDLINILPTYIGCINSSPQNCKIDESSILLMENVKTQDYYTLDRIIGLDVVHAKKALSSLAHYHAMGIALKQKNPSLAKIAIEHTKINFLEKDAMSDAEKSVRQIFENHPFFTKYLDKFNDSWTILKDLLNFEMNCVSFDKPWATITHSDFWINNILFHKNKDGNIDDVKFIDFQTYLYDSALKDLPYFLCGSLDKDSVSNKHMNNLLDTYYQRFVETLQRVNCDTKIYTSEHFKAELKKQAINEFAMCAISLKFFVFEVNERDRDDKEVFNNLLTDSHSDIYIEKLHQLIEIYKINEWF